MRRFAGILLVLAFLGVGTGALEGLHNAQHRWEDAREAAQAVAAGHPVKPHPLHDDSNCELHAQLHVPLLAAGWVPLLVCLGLFVAFLTLLAPPVVSHRPLLTLVCRGPPAC